MSQGIEVVGLYVRDQDEALAFYVDKLGFRVHTDVRNGDYRGPLRYRGRRIPRPVRQRLEADPAAQVPMNGTHAGQRARRKGGP
jgi:catechol 2,3-dioxygenase-like lactoylglutathione lyase family enzyme